ncbi:hypothetical protein L6452_18115 [Arctium lappa]|uniref:Uncharacterized protein n=1 Tax=Arctium lappa TaxID=4217 RepID=A0ACB9C5I6_ARCLA|nr:hypothetical protein L6452_18115 [Arctium lappa]
MILVFLFVSIVLSCLSLICSATYDNISMPICPKSFNCPAFGPFMYPFYNGTDKQCGLIKVNCTLNHENIQFGGHSYAISGKLAAGSFIVIRNTTFQKLIEDQNCEALEDNFTSPTPLLFSISVTPNMPLFKCTNDPSFAEQIDAYFIQSDYNIYNRCKDHKFYYNHPISNTTVPSDLPPTCEVIQLPTKLRSADGDKHNETNIFSLLSSIFTLSFQLSPSCIECRNIKGGQKATQKTDTDSRMTLIWRTKAKNDVNEEIFLKNHEFLAPKRSRRLRFCVYKGALSNGNLVAVKVLNGLKGKGEDFVNKVASVGRTSHVNIVSLVGFCLEGRHRALIYEFMPNGSFEKFIYGWGSSSNSHLGWGKLLQIAIGIARGLEYLHRSCNTRILHFDIKPHNIILDKDLCPKISDFGLAKLFPNEGSMLSMSCMRGTPGYIAPELFSRNFGQVSHKSDVYSYGMMILEMVGGRKNIEDDVDHTSEIYFPHWIYKKVELHDEKLGLYGIMSDEENEMARKMIIVGLWCIQTNPLSRPTITKVLEMLEGDLASMDIPPKPYLSSPSRPVDSSSTS